MPAPPIVSVLIPTYSRVAFLTSCFDSVLSQDFDGVEILISDDCSEDGATWDLCQEYALCDRRIRLIRTLSRLGRIGNLQHCLDEARAPIAKFVLSDDLLYAGALEGLVQPLLDDGSLVLATSKWDVIDGYGEQLPITASFDLGLQDAHIFRGRDLGDTMLMQLCNYIGTPSAAAFRRDKLDPALIDRAGDEVFYFVFDVVMWLRLMLRGPILYRGDQRLSAFRVHDESHGGDSRFIDVPLELWRLQRAAQSLGYLATKGQRRLALVRFLELISSSTRGLIRGDLVIDEATRQEHLRSIGHAVRDAGVALEELA